MSTAYRYGLPPAAEVARMTGREVLQAIVDGHFPQAPISGQLHYWLVEVGDGFAVFEGEPAADIMNPMGTVHGGWALTLIDSVTGCACYTTLPTGVGYTTVETKTNFSRPITLKTGRVRVEGRVVAAGRQIVTAEGRVTSADGKVLAHGTSTLLVLNPT